MTRLSTAISIAFVSMFVFASVASAQYAPEFKLGFRALADQISDMVGAPLENEHWGANGDSLQQTSKGLMVWRKADNWTAFTNGSRTWVNGPFGVMERGNEERFQWEGQSPVAPPPVTQPAAQPAPAPQAASPAPQTISGRGKSVSQKFQLQAGLSTFKMTHVGRSNFAIWLYDSSGERIELLVNEIGSFDGKMALGIEHTGQYVMDVEADGAWSVVVEQPRPTSAPPVPATFSGHGKAVSPFFTLNSGLLTFKMTHNGRSNFSIWLLDRDGNRDELLVNEIGPFNGSKAIGVRSSGGLDVVAGVKVMDIEADGDWSIGIQ